MITTFIRKNQENDKVVLELCIDNENGVVTLQYCKNDIIFNEFRVKRNENSSNKHPLSPFQEEFRKNNEKWTQISVDCYSPSLIVIDYLFRVESDYEALDWIDVNNHEEFEFK